jgi:hypothetical protein
MSDSQLRERLRAYFLANRPPNPFELGAQFGLKVTITAPYEYTFAGTVADCDKEWIEQYRLAGDRFIFVEHAGMNHKVIKVAEDAEFVFEMFAEGGGLRVRVKSVYGTQITFHQTVEQANTLGDIFKAFAKGTGGV